MTVVQSNFNTSLLAVVPLELLIILHFIDRKIDQLIAKIIARLIRNKTKTAASLLGSFTFTYNNAILYFCRFYSN